MITEIHALNKQKSRIIFSEFLRLWPPNSKQHREKKTRTILLCMETGISAYILQIENKNGTERL